MFRRSALGALGAATLFPVLSRPAAAQTAPMAAAGPGAEARLMALAGNVFSAQTSDLAIERAENPMVRAFARFEAAEQRSILQAMQVAGLPVPATVPMPAEKLRMVQQLQAMRGAEFDRQYVAGQILGHRELLRAHQGLLSQGLQAEKVIATLAVTSIEQHIAMLEGLRERMPG